MGDVLTGPGFRVCSRSGCKWPATASLSFSYETRQTWLEELRIPPELSYYDLCHVHAGRFRPPFGWTVEDLRNGARRLEPVPAASVLEADEDEGDPREAELVFRPSLFDRPIEPTPQRLKPERPSGPVATATYSMGELAPGD